MGPQRSKVDKKVGRKTEDLVPPPPSDRGLPETMSTYAYLPSGSAAGLSLLSGNSPLPLLYPD